MRQNLQAELLTGQSYFLPCKGPYVLAEKTARGFWLSQGLWKDVHLVHCVLKNAYPYLKDTSCDTTFYCYPVSWTPGPGCSYLGKAIVHHEKLTHLSHSSSPSMLGINLSLWVPEIWALFSVVERVIMQAPRGVKARNLRVPAGPRRPTTSVYSHVLGAELWQLYCVCNISGIQAQQFVLIGAVRDTFYPWLVHRAQGPVLWA